MFPYLFIWSFTLIEHAVNLHINFESVIFSSSFYFFSTELFDTLHCLASSDMQGVCLNGHQCGLTQFTCSDVLLLNLNFYSAHAVECIPDSVHWGFSEVFSFLVLCQLQAAFI